MNAFPLAHPHDRRSQERRCVLHTEWLCVEPVCIRCAPVARSRGCLGEDSLQYRRELLYERFRRCKYMLVARELVDNHWRKRIRQRLPIPIESMEQRAVERGVMPYPRD